MPRSVRVAASVFILLLLICVILLGAVIFAQRGFGAVVGVMVMVCGVVGMVEMYGKWRVWV